MKKKISLSSIKNILVVTGFISGFTSSSFAYTVVSDATPVVQQEIEIIITNDLCTQVQTRFHPSDPHCMFHSKKLIFPEGGRIVSMISAEGYLQSFLDINGNIAIWDSSIEDSDVFSEMIEHSVAKIKAIYQGPELVTPKQ